VDPDIWLYVAVGAGIAGLLLAVVFSRQVLAAPPGNDRMKELSAAIREGSMAFLKREYTWVAVFVVVMAGLIFALLDYGRPWGAIAYVFGAVLSALAGLIGMRIATAANARTAEAARTGGVRKALPLAFRGGAVMGFTVAGLGLAGLALAFLVFVKWLEVDDSINVLTAVGLGGSTIALFARYLHEGRRRRSRSGRQGRGRHSRGRSPQPSRYCRQCWRQRRRRGRYGGGSFRVLRGINDRSHCLCRDRLRKSTVRR